MMLYVIVLCKCSAAVYSLQVRDCLPDGSQASALICLQILKMLRNEAGEVAYAASRFGIWYL